MRLVLEAVVRGDWHANVCKQFASGALLVNSGMLSRTATACEAELLLSAVHSEGGVEDCANNEDRVLALALAGIAPSRPYSCVSCFGRPCWRWVLV